MAHEFRHETDQQRYAMYVDGALVSVLDEDLVAYAVDDVERRTDKRIVPMCWFVGKWFDDHPDRAALLSRTAAD